MSPILPENRALYPPDWREISDRIRFERAEGRCECTGQCGVAHGGRCPCEHGDGYPRAGKTFDEVDDCDLVECILTTMHLDHDPAHCEDENLLAACQGCHNRYDRPHRTATRHARRHRDQLPIEFPQRAEVGT